MVNHMRTVTLKLKQASVVLGVPPKDLQNLVQMGVVRPARRRNVCWFDASVLLEAKVAFYLKESLGSSSDLLARFTEALSQNLDRTEMSDLGDICLRSRPLNGTDGRLPCHQECFRIAAFAAQLERAEVLVPQPFRYFRFGFHPETQLIEIVQADLAVVHSLDQMSANGGGQPRPRFDLRHYSPKTKRPSSSPRRFTCSGSLAERNRSARSKNSRSFC